MQVENCFEILILPLNSRVSHNILSSVFYNRFQVVLCAQGND